MLAPSSLEGQAARILSHANAIRALVIFGARIIIRALHALSLRVTPRIQVGKALHAWVRSLFHRIPALRIPINASVVCKTVPRVDKRYRLVDIFLAIATVEPIFECPIRVGNDIAQLAGMLLAANSNIDRLCLIVVLVVVVRGAAMAGRPNLVVPGGALGTDSSHRNS